MKKLITVFGNEHLVSQQIKFKKYKKNKIPHHQQSQYKLLPRTVRKYINIKVNKYKELLYTLQSI